MIVLLDSDQIRNVTVRIVQTDMERGAVIPPIPKELGTRILHIDLVRK